MPSRDRQPAKFGPIPPNLDLHALVEQTPNFRWVDRISCRAIDEQGIDAFDKTVERHVIKQGLPLVVDGWHHKLERWTFSSRWLHDNVGNKTEQARWLEKQQNMPLSMSHYLSNMGKLCDQFNHFNYKEPNRQRLYLKDIDCPELWHEKLKETIPGSVFYLNESTGEIGGPGAIEEKNTNGIGTRKSRGVARAGDLMSCLPPSMRAENLMCYIGPEGTYTPAHREMCASLGQNIMVEASEALDEGGQRAKPGSSIWFMTETPERQVVSEYWLSSLGHDIEVEKHFAHINAWRKAPFNVYVVEQKIGDLILIPPLAPHQVWNRGTRTMKVAWNRTTVDTLELALDEALPRARLVCRDEQYKNKSIVLFSLNKYYGLLSSVEERKSAAAQRGDEAALRTLDMLKIKQLRRDFKRLFRMFNAIMLSESFSPDLPGERRVEYLPYDSCVTCAYCRGNIFNRFLTCRHCVLKDEDENKEDNYDVCMECYAMGRGCRCVGKLEWVEQFPWRDLMEKHELWRKLYIQIDGGPKENSPQQFSVERKFQRVRTLAEICQLELKKRPFKDPTKPETESESSDNSEEEAAAESNSVKKKKTKNSKKKKANGKGGVETQSCHLCFHRHPKWKEAICIRCNTAYCYGSLWRGFDTMPQQVMEDKEWTCPKCQQICTCSSCAKNPNNRPYEPTGTVLGHDTRQFADPRSFESLVDFSVSNRHWIRKSGDVDGPEESRRIQRRRSQALYQQEIARIDDEISDGETGGEYPLPDTPDSRPGTSDDDIPIDPALTGGMTQDFQNAQNQATKALETMNLLTRLESDPNGSTSAVDLPFPTMDDHSVKPTDNRPTDAKSSEGREKTGKRPVSKRPRKRGPSKDAVDPVTQEEGELGANGSTANQQFQAMAERKRMGEAKKNNKLIAARAAIRGLQKIIVLKLSAENLSRFANAKEADAMDVQVHTPPPNDAMPIVESNLSRGEPATQTVPTNTMPTKKRPRNEDLDEDWVSLPSRERRTQKQIRELKASAAKDTEIIEDPSDEDLAQDEICQVSAESAPSGIDSSKSTKRRSLPGYLAQRNEIVTDASIPKELRSEPRTRARKENGSTLQIPSADRTGGTDRSGAGEDEVRVANRMAKLRAAQGLDSSESENLDEADDIVENARNTEAKTTKNKTIGRGATVAGKADSTPAAKTRPPSSAPTRGGRGGSMSIFSKRGGAKIKVVGRKR